MGAPRLTRQTFTCDGTKMRILKTITLEPDEVVQDVEFTSGHTKICVSTKVCRLDRIRLNDRPDCTSTI